MCGRNLNIYDAVLYDHQSSDLYVAPEPEHFRISDTEVLYIVPSVPSARVISFSSAWLAD